MVERGVQFIPEQGTPVNELAPIVVYVGQGEAKNLYPQKSEGKGALPLQRLIGTKLHFAVAHADDPLDMQEELWLDKNEHYPEIVQLWSLTMFEAMDELRALQPTPDGWVTTTIYEFSLPQTKTSAEAGSRIEQALTNERADGMMHGPVATALSISSSRLKPGEQDGYKDNILRKLQPFLPEGFDEDLQASKSHTVGLDGKLIWLPTIRGDGLKISFEQGDDHARLTTIALRQLLASNSGYDPQYLAATEFHFDVVRGRRLNGFDIIHDAAQLMVDGRLIFNIDEYKTKSLLGNYKDIAPVWEEHGGDVGSLLASLDEHRGDPAYEYWINSLAKDEFDMVKTKYAMAAFFNHGLKGYYERNGVDDTNTVITINDVAPKINGNLVWIGLDVRNGKHITNSIDHVLSYITIPPIEEVGCPEKATVGLRKISHETFAALYPVWERQVYDKHFRMQRTAISRLVMSRSVNKKISVAR